MNQQLQQRATAKEMTKQITKTNTRRKSLQRLTKRVVQAPTLEARAQESEVISIKGKDEAVILNFLLLTSSNYNQSQKPLLQII